MKPGYCKKIILIAAFLFLALSSVAKAANAGDIVNFNVDQGFDSSSRLQVAGTLVKVEPNLYFYVEKAWWDSLAFQKQTEIIASLDNLSQEFDTKIYPGLTSVFGQEWRPGIDADNKITVFFQSMKNDFGGYFRTADEYPKIQVPNSNEREMLYLPIEKLSDQYQLKVLLAHELTHLITFNQKDRAFGLSEDTWLNEARADYSATLLGYNDNYPGSILDQRVKDFLENPSDSLTEWKETKSDYAVASIFTHYLVDYYGVSVLSNSLKLNAVGIDSINQALKKEGAQEDFAQIFTNWTIAVAVNDCSSGKYYCYQNRNLQTLRLTPNLNFLPITGSSSLSVTNTTKNWAGSWQKVFGGNGNLKLAFNGNGGQNFKVPYIVQDNTGNVAVNFLALDKNQSGQAFVPDFGIKNTAIIIIPSLQAKTSGFADNEPSYPYTFTVSVGAQNQLPVTPNPAVPDIPKIPAGFYFNNNLYYGMASQDVVYMKVILASKGCLLSRLVNINAFGPVTLAAVKCLQQKYSTEISKYAGYKISATGYVGPGTRKELNILLGGLTGS